MLGYRAMQEMLCLGYRAKQEMLCLGYRAMRELMCLAYSCCAVTAGSRASLYAGTDGPLEP
jgi:hypothetical protein